MTPDTDRPSLAAVYDAVNAVRADMAELKTDTAVIKSTLVDLDDHEKRIRALETRMWAAIGGFGLIAALSPYLTRLIA